MKKMMEADVYDVELPLYTLASYTVLSYAQSMQSKCVWQWLALHMWTTAADVFSLFQATDAASFAWFSTLPTIYSTGVLPI